jgi:penicillin-binding protein 2
LASGSVARRPPSRRFLPPDPRVDEPFRLTPRLALRLGILGVLALVLFAALFLRLWALQVLNGAQYLRTAQSNQLRTVRIQAPRGPVLDRNGKVLVSNSAATAVQLWPADLPKRYADRIYELRRLSRIIDVPFYSVATALRKRAGDPLTPVTVKGDAREDEIYYLREHQGEFPGVQVAEAYVRHYPYGALGSQVLGYVGEVSAEQLKADAKSGYRSGDVIGQSGVESSYDTYLRGQDGIAHLRVDSRGRPVSDFTPVTPPHSGHALKLTLDLGLQKAAEAAIPYGIRLAHAGGDWAANGGSIVALDPRNGAVLAMASSPTYKPSLFAGRVTRKGLAGAGLTSSTAAAKNYPSLNRALMGTYPPGSTFKPVTALAAMQERLLSPYADELCTGSYKSHGQTFFNWDKSVYAWINLPTALSISCDTYFYKLGEAFYHLPASHGHPLQAWASRFGFGARTGIDLGPEEPGLLPTPEWRRERFTKQTDPCCWRIDKLWKPGNSIQLAIGQGDLLVTPLQMARFYALIANGGRLVTPHLLFDVENPNGSAVPVPALPAPLASNVDPAALEAVRAGLYAAAHSSLGTSYGTFGSFPVPIAGKTGTAEKVITLPGYTGLQNQSWWCGYGPFNDPKIVVCAVIENGGHGGTAAAPAALKVFQEFFRVKDVNLGTIHSD